MRRSRPGTLRALALTGEARWPDLPDVPTMLELGWPGFVSETFQGFLAPAGTPAPIILRLAREAAAVLGDPAIRARLLAAGFALRANGPEALAARIAAEVPLWRALIEQAGPAARMTRRAAGPASRRAPGRMRCCAGDVRGEGSGMSIKGKAYIAGAFEHPTRLAKDKSVAQLHAESALGALRDAGLTKADVDGYFCAGDAPGLGPLAMADYMNLTLRHLDSTDVGGCSYLVACGPCGGGDRRRQVLGRADHPGGPAAVGGPFRRGAAGARRRCAGHAMGIPDRHRHGECLCDVSRRGTCTSSAPPASSSPGSRSPPATMRSTTRMPCCGTW